MPLLAQTGSSLSGLIVPGALMVGMYFLLIRPQRNRQKAQQALLEQIAVGDKVMTAGGIFGSVRAIDDEQGRIVVEIAPGVPVEMLRAAVRERIVADVAGEAESGS